MKLKDICKPVYDSCPDIKSQEDYIDKLFEAAGAKPYISLSYKKGFFSGSRTFTVNQRLPLRGKDNSLQLISFFEKEISDAGKVLAALGIPEKENPNKKALAIALAQQMKLLIDSEEEDVENILILQYEQAKQDTVEADMPFSKPLYTGDSISVYHKSTHVILSYDKVTHTWEILNSGSIPWIGRKLVYKRKPTDRPEANPDVIELPDIKPNESKKISTVIDGRGFDGITHCIWEMQDSDGENCFPDRESLFCVTIDAKFKRK